MREINYSLLAEIASIYLDIVYLDNGLQDDLKAMLRGDKSRTDFRRRSLALRKALIELDKRLRDYDFLDFKELKKMIKGMAASFTDLER